MITSMFYDNIGLSHIIYSNKTEYFMNNKFICYN